MTETTKAIGPSSAEQKALDILAQKPDDFWTNMDLAQIRKKENNILEYLRYMDKALSNENVFADTRAKVQEDVAKNLHLSSFPKPGTSPILRAEEHDIDTGWSKPDVLQGPEQKRFSFWDLFDPHSDDIVHTVVTQ